MSPRRSRFMREVRSYFKEYCDHTSIHGFQYFSGKRSYIELIWWLIVFILCLSCCGYFIVIVYKKWEDSPVIVSFATRETPIYEIPFPAVTICPETKAILQEYNHSKLTSKWFHGEEFSEEEHKHFSYMNLICDSFDEEPDIKPENTTLEDYFVTHEELFGFLLNVTPNIYDNLYDCRWMGKQYECDELFDLIWTDEGMCATFNALDHSQIYKSNVLVANIPNSKMNTPKDVTWSLDVGYTEEDDIQTYPRRALFAGASNALNIVLTQPPENIDHSCKSAMQGFKITLHTPSRVPSPAQQYLRVPLNEEVVAAIKPVMVTTSETVKVFKPEIRECYFANEKPLKYFRTYTQKNCQLACLTQFTLKWCGCVTFYMPRENGTLICGSYYEPCVEEAEKIVQKGYLNKIKGIKHNKTRSHDHIYEKSKGLDNVKNDTYNSDLFGYSFMDNIDSSNIEDYEIPQCDCLPLCTDLTYGVETSSSFFDPQDLSKAVLYKNESKIIPKYVSVLVIYFQNNQFVTSKRHELYGPSDFLANFGGLLGLFTGFSILSFMEIIYFLTVRIICNIKLYGSWSGRENKEKDVEKNL